MSDSKLEQRLLYAAVWHDCSVIRELVAQGANVNARGEGGNSALISLVQQPPEPGDNGDDVMLAHLIRFTEDPTYRSTPEEIETMSFLLDHGLRLDLTDAGGGTALACAAFGGNRPAVDFLLSVGADYLDRGEDSLSPFDIAVREDRHDLLALFLERARDEGRLAAIDADPRHGRWIDEATGVTARQLEAAFGRSSKDARAKVRVLEVAGELNDEAPMPVELYFNADGTVVFWRGPILKLCPRCGYVFRNFYDYGGSRYGLVGGYECPRCLTGYILQDDDQGGSPIHYVIRTPEGYETLMSLDYTHIYRLDALSAAAARHAPGLFDDLRDRSRVTLADVMERLRSALPTQAPEVAESLWLEGRNVPPPDVATWISWVEKLLPSESP